MLVNNMKKIFNKKNLIRFIFLDSLFLFIFVFMFYGPWNGFRDFWITSSMTTMSHQYLATSFYSNDVIEKVLEDNSIIEKDTLTDPNLISFRQYTSKIYKNKYDEEILNHEKDELYKLIDIRGEGYRGYLVAIYDPSRVKLATSMYLGERGEDILTVGERENAIIAMNGGGFYDPDWNSNGSTPHGTVIKDGKVVSEFRSEGFGGLIGFDDENRLILGKINKHEAKKMNIRDAIEYGPFLIVNGKRSFVRGNGGWGIANRSVIGQREDGIVLFLVIDGRIPSSIGADMNDLCDIMENYGAVNAANLDGGASSELTINNKIINRPVAGGKDGLRWQPTFWVVK